jgi:hypothetical protein
MRISLVNVFLLWITNGHDEMRNKYDCRSELGLMYSIFLQTLQTASLKGIITLRK